MSTVPVYKKKRRLVISGKVIFQYFQGSTVVLSRKYCSTFREILKYCLRSTVVLSGKYWSTAKKVLETLKVKNYRELYN